MYKVPKGMQDLCGERIIIPLLDKMKIIQQVKSNTHCHVLYSFSNENKKLGKVITDCINSYIRYVVIIGEDEYKEGKHIVKDLQEKAQCIENL